MKRLLAPDAAACLAAAVAAVLSLSGSVQAPPPAGGAPGGAAAAKPPRTDWGAPDGGSVTIMPNGTYLIILDDMSDHSSIFSEGHVHSSEPTPEGGRIFRLKPTTPGQATTVFEVIAKPDGTAELWVDKSGQRHMAAALKP